MNGEHVVDIPETMIELDRLSGVLVEFSVSDRQSFPGVCPAQNQPNLCGRSVPSLPRDLLTTFAQAGRHARGHCRCWRFHSMSVPGSLLYQVCVKLGL